MWSVGHRSRIFSHMAETTKLPLSFDTLAVERAGGPIVARRKSVESLNEDEVLIRVSYASINKMDPLLARRNLFNFPEPYVLGFDFSGEVVSLGGEGEGALRVGDLVFGRSGGGACFAEYVVVKREHVMLRGAMPAAEASTYGIAYLTAYESVVLTGDIQRHAGKRMYVAGAGGGVGHFAAQMAKLYGLKVIGTAGKPASLDLLRQLRLDCVIDRSKQDVVKEIMSVTGGKGADVVYDSTGAQSSYVQSAAAVAPGGEYIRLGTDAQLKFSGSEDVTPIVESRGAKMLVADLARYSVEPQYRAQMPKVVDGQKQAVTWYEQGKVRPIITETVPFDATALGRAFDAFAKGINNVGKVVVRCS